jgi:protein required for attachment to host cells
LLGYPEFVIKAPLTRVVVADQSEADFYDMRGRGALKPAGHLADPKARLHDRDLTSDRPGRVFDRAPPAKGRRGAGARHSADGGRSPRKHRAEVFARKIVAQLRKAQRSGSFDRLVIIAAPAFLGLLRLAMPKTLREAIVREIPKDLVHQGVGAVRSQLARR